MRIATFNVQNLRLRRMGDELWLDGARDADLPEDAKAGAVELDLLDRRLTAAVLGDIDADIVALQEVFDRETLDHFHDRFLLPVGMLPYPHRICLPGNDGRGLDVALLSRHPVDEVQSHAALTPADLDISGAPNPDAPIFRRDCLMARIGRLTLFVCHFKAPYPDAAVAWPIRHLEALAVRRLIERRFPSGAEGYWLVLGDMNEPEMAISADRSAIAPLARAFAVDLMERLPALDRWTYRDPGSGRYSRPDVLLASPSLARDWPEACPTPVRKGLGHEARVPHESQLAGVGHHRPHASDHAAVVIEFEGM